MMSEPIGWKGWRVWRDGDDEAIDGIVISRYCDGDDAAEEAAQRWYGGGADWHDAGSEEVFHCRLLSDGTVSSWSVILDYVTTFGATRLKPEAPDPLEHLSDGMEAPGA